MRKTPLSASLISLAGRLAALLALLALALTLPPARAQIRPPKKTEPAVGRPAPARDFLVLRNNTELWRGNYHFRNLGANLPDLYERFLHRDDRAAIDMLSRAQAAGVRYTRCFGVTWGPDDFGLFETDRARWMDAYDRMLAAADYAGISVVPSLLFNIHMVPDYIRRKTGKDEEVVDYLTPGTPSNQLAVTYVTAIVSRYKNDPRILFWEIGNEYNLEADLSAQWKKRPRNQIPTSDQIRAFLVQMATLVKTLDKKHLVTSGNSDMRPGSWHLRQAMLAHRDAPDPTDYPMDWTQDSFDEYTQMLDFFNPAPFDLISVHQYPPGKEKVRWLNEDDDHALRLPWTRLAAERLPYTSRSERPPGKPLFIGEFGQPLPEHPTAVDSAWLVDYFQRIQHGTAPLAAVWAWEFGTPEADGTSYSLSRTRTPEIIDLLANINAILLRNSLAAPYNGH